MLFYFGPFFTSVLTASVPLCNKKNLTGTSFQFCLKAVHIIGPVHICSMSGTRDPEVGSQDVFAYRLFSRPNSLLTSHKEQVGPDLKDSLRNDFRGTVNQNKILRVICSLCWKSCSIVPAPSLFSFLCLSSQHHDMLTDWLVTKARKGLS